MGILIKAPTRRTDPGLQLASPGRRRATTRGVSLCTSVKWCESPACDANSSICGSGATGSRIRRAMASATASIRPTRSRGSRSSSSCCRKAGAPAPLFRWPNRRCNRCSASPSRIRCRCRRKSRPRSSFSAEHRVGELQNHLSKLLVGQGLRRFLEQTLIPLNEAVHEHVVRGDMQNFQELRFADIAQRLLRDVTRLVRPTRNASQILLATPSERSQSARARDSRAAALHRRHQLPDPGQRRAGAGSRRRGARLQGVPGDSAVRPGHFRQDRRTGNTLAEDCLA